MRRPTLLLQLSALAVTAVIFSAAVPAHATQEQGHHAAGQPQKAESPDEGIYKEASAALEKKDYKEAADKLSVIVNKYPFSPLYEAALFQLGQALFKSGSREEGVKLFENALLLYPGSSYSREAALLAGDYYYEQKRPDDALKHYSFLLEHFSGPSLSDHIYFRGGKLKMAKGDMEGAVQEFEHLVREHSSSPYFNEGVVDLITAYNRVGKAYQGAELVEKYPKRFLAMADDGQGLLAASDSYLALGLYDRALAVLADIDGSYPKSRLKLNALVQKGKAFKGQHEYDKAEKILKQALSINRQSPEAVLVLSTLYSEKGQTREALATVEAFSRPGDDRIGMLLAVQKGMLLSKVQRYGDALKAYDNALSITEKLKAADPQAKETLPRIYLGMGDTLFSQEKFPAAIDAYRKAKDAGASQEDLPWVLYRLGDSWEKVGDSAKAAESYQALLTSTADPFWTGRANGKLEGITWQNRHNKELQPK